MIDSERDPCRSDKYQSLELGLYLIYIRLSPIYFTRYIDGELSQ